MKMPKNIEVISYYKLNIGTGNARTVKTRAVDTDAYRIHHQKNGAKQRDKYIPLIMGDLGVI